jgi:hypothetical protein
MYLTQHELPCLIGYTRFTQDPSLARAKGRRYCELRTRNAMRLSRHLMPKVFKAYATLSIFYLSAAKQSALDII